MKEFVWEGGIWEGGTWEGGTWEGGLWEKGWIFDPEGKGNFGADWEWADDYVASPISPKEYFAK